MQTGRMRAHPLPGTVSETCLKSTEVDMTERLRGRAGVAQRKRRLARTNGLCEMCLAEGKTVIATVVDHRIPLALGGSDEDENTRNLCDAHNDKVTAEQFGHRERQAIGSDGWPLP
jgi:5-methylcytosine-specific restriction protein A